MFANGLIASVAAAVAVATASPAAAGSLQLASPTVKAGGVLPKEHLLNGFGCDGLNRSPALNWTGAPAGTKSFALTLYDPDAPTGSGWWHWVAFNIPASVAGLPEGAELSAPIAQGRNDFGSAGYGGACPPAGARPHRYVFTLFALDTDRLEVPADASPAMIGFNIRAHAIGQAKLTAKYGRGPH